MQGPRCPKKTNMQSHAAMPTRRSGAFPPLWMATELSRMQDSENNLLNGAVTAYLCSETVSFASFYARSDSTAVGWFDLSFLHLRL